MKRTHSSVSQRHCNIYTQPFHFHHLNDAIQRCGYTPLQLLWTVEGQVYPDDRNRFSLLTSVASIRADTMISLKGTEGEWKFIRGVLKDLKYDHGPFTSSIYCRHFSENQNYDNPGIKL